MIVYLILGITLLIALLSLIVAYRGASRGGWLQLLCGAALAIFIYLYGAWVYCSVYLAYFFACLFIATAAAGLLGARKQHRYNGLQQVTNTIGVILPATLTVLYFTGTTGTPESVSLPLPFKNGTYYIFQGGKGLPTNLFHFSSRHAVYAVDLIKLNGNGQRSRHIFSKDLNDYFIFNDTVYSPCEGIIERAVDDNPDNIPPERKRGPHNLNGVVIANHRFYLFMGHFKYRSVFVHTGDRVVAGTPLGLAGNSGSSLEPHLHIQAHKKEDEKPWYRQDPLFIRFYGKEYLLFQEIKTQSD